jgi:hypothetical protein
VKRIEMRMVTTSGKEGLSVLNRMVDWLATAVIFGMIIAGATGLTWRALKGKWRKG